MNLRSLLIVTTLAIICFAFLTALAGPTRDRDLPDNFQSPVIAAELVRTSAEIVRVYGLTHDDNFTRSLRCNTFLDFGLIAGYSLNLFLLGRLLSGKLGKLVMVLTPIAALCDVIENFGILAASSRVATDSIAGWIRTPSLIKWFLLGIVWLILFRLYLPGNLSKAWRVVELTTGVLYAAGGLIGIWGVLAENRRIEQSVAPIALATVMQLFVLLFDGGFFQSRYAAKPL